MAICTLLVLVLAAIVWKFWSTVKAAIDTTVGVFDRCVMKKEITVTETVLGTVLLAIVFPTLLVGSLSAAVMVALVPQVALVGVLLGICFRMFHIKVEDLVMAGAIMAIVSLFTTRTLAVATVALVVAMCVGAYYATKYFVALFDSPKVELV